MGIHAYVALKGAGQGRPFSLARTSSPTTPKQTSTYVRRVSPCSLTQPMPPGGWSSTGRGCRDVQGLLAEGEMHPQQERARSTALLRRGVRGQGKDLPGNLPLREGLAQ